MKAALDILEERISAAMAATAGREDCAAIVRPATDAKFGDYQANGIMWLAKKLKTNPRKLAEEVVKNLDLSDICEPPEVAGPGFINLRLKAEFVAGELLEINKDAVGLGIDKTPEPKTIVVDFSSPNIAKQMHVGHLRSTIIGDCLCRTLECLGHKVIRQNHVGDWGTQFGRAFLAMWHISMGKKQGQMYHRKNLEEIRDSAKDNEKLVSSCKRICSRHTEDWRADSLHKLGDGKKVFWPFIQELKRNEDTMSLEEIEAAYRYVTKLEETVSGMELRTSTRKRDSETGEWKEKRIPYEQLSRDVTVMLQEGGEDNEQEREVWQYLIKKTLAECNEIYRLLNVTLEDRHVRGESFYRGMLPGIVKGLKDEGVAEESEGAVCVFPEGFKTKEGTRLPFIIQKSDGAYLYATTDLAALQYRLTGIEYDGRIYRADRIVYVTDARQALHFRLLAATAIMADWGRDDTRISHIMFGSVLGEDGAPLKTRSGENVKLKELLDGAVKRAMSVVEEKNPDLPAYKKAEIAKAVGIGAVKYADYSNNRASDYVFSFDKMLAMEGNTAPYMQYAYARISSIMKKGKDKGIETQKEVSSVNTLNLSEPAELDLAKYLVRYGEAIQSAVVDYRPNYLTAYLYELAQKFSAFYTNCPVLIAGPDKRPTRLLLCDLTARTIRHGLHELLGINVVEQM